MEKSKINIPWSDWSLVQPLGQGGFGKVYEIERNLYDVKEKAAMKIVTIPNSHDDVEMDYSDGYSEQNIRDKYKDYMQDILKEYQLMSDLKGHSNIVSADDISVKEHVGEIGWDIFIRMELLTPLQKWLRSIDRNMTQEEVIKLGKDICQALVVCEKKKIIHRDIKPENIMISEYGDYKLGDFGIARTMDHTTHATKAGTERYMAPEVIKQERYGREVDIYSLGLVIYWLLNERKMPFLPLDRIPSSQEMNDAQYRRIHGEAFNRPARGSRELQDIVLKACSYLPANRYHSAQEMLTALENIPMNQEESQGGSEQGSSTDHSGTESSGLSNGGGCETLGGGQSITSGGDSQSSGSDAGWNTQGGTIGKKVPSKEPPNVSSGDKTSIGKGIDENPPGVGPHETPPESAKPIFPCMVEGQQLERLPYAKVPTLYSWLVYIGCLGFIIGVNLVGGFLVVVVDVNRIGFFAGLRHFHGVNLGIMVLLNVIAFYCLRVYLLGKKWITVRRVDGELMKFIVTVEKGGDNFEWALAVRGEWVIAGRGKGTVIVEGKGNDELLLVNYHTNKIVSFAKTPA